MGNNGVSVNDLQNSLQTFGIADYVVFSAMLFGCSLIGIWYAYKGHRQGQDAALEYLMGGRNMSVFPVALSLIASFISAITLLGNPTELYLFGTEYFFITIVVSLSGLISSIVFLPVLHDLKLNSVYEYLEARFDKKVRLFGSISFVIALTCWLPIVIYAPALAFNQVSGVEISIIAPCVCLVCIFYTTVGGLKAVVWTDVVQIWMMIGAMILIAVKGTLDVGGFNVVWHRAWESGRVEAPSFQPDLTDRHSFWSLCIGALFVWLPANSIDQMLVQRYMSLAKLSHARCAMGIFVTGAMFIMFIGCYNGMVIYATYHDCDPLTTKLAKAKDQLLPLLVMKVLGKYPGMPGLFVAGVFSAALSSLSTGLNSMSAVVLQDFVQPFTSRKMSDRATNFVMKSVVVVFGAVCVSLVFVAAKLGTVLQLAISVAAISTGPIFGIFCGGVLLPWMNRKGALYGGLAGLVTSAIIILGSQNAIASGHLKFPTKPTSVEGCNYSYLVNVTSTPAPDLQDSYVFPLFKISYLWFSCIGCLVTVVVAMVISYFTGCNDLTKIDPMHVSPVIRKYLPRRKCSASKLDGTEVIEIFKVNKDGIEGVVE